MQKEKKFSALPFGENKVLTVKNNAGVDLLCNCHKTPPYPVQSPSSNIVGAMSVTMKERSCNTGCLRATIIEKDGKPFWQQDCEANILQLELTEVK